MQQHFQSSVEQVNRNSKAVERLFLKTAVKSDNLPRNQSRRFAHQHLCYNSHELIEEKMEPSFNKYYQSLYTTQRRGVPEFLVRDLCRNDASHSPLDIPTHMNRQLRASASIAAHPAKKNKNQPECESTSPTCSSSAHVESHTLSSNLVDSDITLLNLPTVENGQDESSEYNNTTANGNASSSNFALRLQIAKHAIDIPKFDENNVNVSENIKNNNSRLRKADHAAINNANYKQNCNISQNQTRSSKGNKGNDVDVTLPTTGHDVVKKEEQTVCYDSNNTSKITSRSPDCTTSNFTHSRLTRAERDKLHKSAVRHGRAVDRYEHTLPQRRVMDSYVASYTIPGNNVVGRVRPNNAMASRLTSVYQGKWPLNNVHHQQLLNGEPLLTRLLRGEFYEGVHPDRANQQRTKPRNFLNENKHITRAMSATTLRNHDTTGKP